MSAVSCMLCFFFANVILTQCILLENINHPLPTSSPHPDTLVFLMQEVMQVKNDLQEKSKEISELKMIVNNQSLMLTRQSQELELLRNINNSNEITKLHAEISILKFSIENSLNDKMHSANLTDVVAKLHALENAVRQFTLTLNTKVSKTELFAIQTNITALSRSVAKISSHEAPVDTLLKNITQRVHALEYDKVIPGRIRLVNGSTSWMGRVEVSYNGSWATVPGRSPSSYTFDNRAAQVVCRMLGYPTKYAVAIHENSPLYFGKGTGHINMDLYDLQCTGNESSLSNCSRFKYTNPYLFHRHRYDIGVVCMDIRLAGGSSPLNGRVEVNLGEGWGTVCDDSWDNNEAQVVCRMLGYHGSSQALQGTATTGGAGVMWMDDLQCTGGESSLAQCKRSSYDIGFAACSHPEDARVVCHA